ncbi:hypothetical protein BKA69DRAFT_1099029 [Paraphysoderma sedebokerense]|nr:hypothetical protein BKA69DRAFT_1099029 [Paraphysoderma sedebokerense]
MVLPNIKRVCVIGAGPAGLVAVKYLIQSGIDAVCFEQNSDVGGTWIYNEIDNSKVYDKIDVESPFDFVSPIYESLRTNLPFQVMEFSDFPFTHSADSTTKFPPHHEVLSYIQSYARRFNLKPHIRFNTYVTQVEKLLDSGDCFRWRIEYITSDGESCYEWVDAVIIGNGHYQSPYIPEIPGLQSFTGTILHSKFYRRPDSFKGKSVIVVGGGPSGCDISREITPLSSSTYMSVKNPEMMIAATKDPDSMFMVSTLPNFSILPDIKFISSSTVTFVDGSSKIIDGIVFATGYKYTYPFLFKYAETNNLSITDDGQSVMNLYKQMIYIPDPTLVFIGLPMKVSPFVTIEYQIRYICKLFTRQIHLPEPEAMKHSLKIWLAECATTGAKAHSLRGESEMQYLDDLDVACGGAGISEAWKDMRRRAFGLRKKELFS